MKIDSKKGTNSKSMADNQEKRNTDTATANRPAENACGNSSGLSSFFAFSEKLSSSVSLKWLIIALLPALILLSYPVDRTDYDLWWQMANGRYFIDHHTLRIDPSIFSWTPADPTWIYNTCLGSIAVYLFYSFMGGFGLWLFQWLIFGGIFLSFYLFLRLLHQRLDINKVTLIAAIGIACSISCSFYKPELFSALLFCWMVFIFFYIKIKRSKYLFYLYPMIFAFWVNLHGAFLVGLVFLALAFAGEFLNRIFFPRESLTTGELVHFAAAGVLSGAATLLNPYGADYLISLLPAIKIAIVKSQTENLILAHSSLWSYLKDISIPFFYINVTVWLMALMIFSVLIFSVYEFIKKRSFDFTLLIVSLVLYWKGMQTGRASYFFLFAFFFIFFYLLFHRLKLENPKGRATVISLLVFVSLFTGVAYINIRCQPDNNWFGKGLDSFVPAQEVAFLKKHKLEGPIFNDYLTGGYLVWALYPDYKVFIDPRHVPYFKEVSPDYFELISRPATAEDINRFTAKYPFKIAIIHYSELPLIFSFLEAGGQWRLLYFEKNAVILIHKSLFPVIRAQAANIDLSPQRFRAVRNPDVLYNVFKFYVRLNPEEGRVIYDIAKTNISDYYRQKQELLNAMDAQILLRENELQDKSTVRRSDIPEEQKVVKIR
jgi:hypothetical protein